MVIYIQQELTAEMWSTQMRPTAFGAIKEINTPEKEGWPRHNQSDGRP